MPELRFPGFEGEWEEISLGSVGKVSMCKRIMKEETKPNGDVPFYKIGTFGKQADAYISREVFENYKSSYSYPKKGDILISAAGTIGRLVVFDGEEAYFQDSNIVWIDNDENLIKNDFLFHCYNNVKWTTDDNTIPRLYNDNLRGMKIFITSVTEQSRIADCLSSVDELITAGVQKLDALKEHKKGLMQGLFPAVGETAPKLRFPGFEGEWEEKTIQELIDSKIIIGHLDGNHGELYPRSDEFSERGIPYISANDFASGSVDFAKCKYLPEDRAKLFKKGVAKNGDILFAHNATVGPVTKLKTNFDFVILSTTATYFRCDNLYLVNDFLQFLLSSPKFVEQYTRVMKQSTRNQVPITTQRKFQLDLPKPEEQSRIADCLSSLDELISAQAEKVEALKLHKKGLMQGLFPVVGEVEG